LNRISHARTNLVQHLVTLVENEGLHVAQGQFLVTDQRVQTTGSGHHNVGVGFLVGQDFDVLLDRSTTVEDRSLNIGQVLRETGVLVLNLISELTGVAHDQDLALARNGLQLVEGGENEDRGFTETRLGLAKNVDVQNGSRNANLLDCWKAEPMLDWVRRKKKQKKNPSRNVRPSPDNITSMRGRSSSTTWSDHHHCMSHSKAMLFVNILSYSADNMRCASQGDKRDRYQSCTACANIHEVRGSWRQRLRLSARAPQDQTHVYCKEYCPFPGAIIPMSSADSKHDGLPNTDRRIFPQGWTDVGDWTNGGTLVGIMS
jgi:hypothetical protein